MTIGGRLSLEDVLDFLDGQPNAIIERVLDVRETIFDLVPAVTETIHWRALSYHDESVGGHVRGAICQVTVRDGEVWMSFIHGAGLPDPHGLLVGTGKAKRHVRISSSRMLRGAGVADLVRSAAELVACLQGGRDLGPRRRS